MILTIIVLVFAVAEIAKSQDYNVTGDFESTNQTANVTFDLPYFAGLIVKTLPDDVDLLPRRKISQPTLGDEKDRILRVVVIKEPPFVDFHNITDGMLVFNNKTGPGAVISILNEFARRHSLKYYYLQQDDEVWGEEVEAGLWTGVIGSLQRKEADLVAGAMILRHDRQEVIDQSYPFVSSETGMMIRSPRKDVENRFLIVTAPFKWQVWALTAVTVVVSGFIMKALCKVMVVASEVQYTWLESIWLFFSIFVQQGLPVQPKSWTCRTMLAFWWLAALTLVATFTGNMVALFAVKRDVLPFNSPDELLQKVRYDGYRIVTAVNSLSRVKLIQTSKLVVFKNLWYEMTVKRKWLNVTTLEEGIRLVKAQQKLVLIGPKETLEVFADEDCQLTVTSNGIIPLMYSFGLSKGSPYTNLLSNETRQLVEAGLVNKWLKDYRFLLPNKQDSMCRFTEGVQTAGDPIAISKAQGAFWILLGGVALALVVVFFEHLIRVVTRIWSGKLHLNQGQTVYDQNGTFGDVQTTFSSMIRDKRLDLSSESAKEYQPSYMNDNNNAELKKRRINTGKV